MSSSLANMLLLAAGAVWGMGFIAQQTAMETLGPMAFVGIRFLIAGLAVLPLAMREFAKSSHPMRNGSIRGFLGVGVLFFLAVGLQQIGLLETTVTNAGFLTALYVILVPLILRSIYSIVQPPVIWPSALLALVGIYLLGDGGLAGLTRGDWFVIVCALFTAMHVIYTERIGRFSGLPICMATAQFLICGILGLAGHFVSQFGPVAEPAITLDAMRSALVELVYAGIVSGALAFTLQAVAQRYTSASLAAVLLSSESLFAAVFGALLLGDRLAMHGYLGCSLIFVAILTVQLVANRQQPAAR